MEMHHHFIEDKLQNEEINVVLNRTDDQATNISTKAMGKVQKVAGYT